MIFCVFLLAGCGVFPSGPAETELFTALVWNVQALFDGNEDGNEYAEFRETAGWTEEKYQARLNAISQAIQQIMPAAESSKADKPQVPGLIGLVEIENSSILEDLASLSKRGYPKSTLAYNWTAFASLDGSSLGLGVLSRCPIVDGRSHSITVGGETAPRPVLEVRIQVRDKPLVFLLCHWKSKLGKDTETLRRASAKLVQRRLQEIEEREAGTPLIVMGDLNENHDEFYLRGVSALCALLPDDPGAAALALQAPAAQDFLVLSGEKPPRTFAAEKTSALYSPWMEELSGGSYFYRGGWETIDHFLLSRQLFDGAGWDFAGCQVLNREPFTLSNGAPNAYVPKSGRGLSDHLPLILYIKDS